MQLLLHVHMYTHLPVPRVTKLGGEAISDKEKEAILNARKEAQSLYQQVCSTLHLYIICTFRFNDPFPIPYPSAIPTMLYLLKNTIAQVQNAFVEEPEEKLDSTAIIIPSLTPTIMMRGVGAIQHCRDSCKQLGRSSSSYEVRRD